MRWIWGALVVLGLLAAGCGGDKKEGTPVPACGNGVVEAGEVCDQGAQNSNSTPGACRTDCKPAHCGDGVVDPNEACDDGNSDNTDACTTSCKSPSCGDGIKQTGEECDDGPNNSDSRADACRTNCLKAHCGDSIQDAGESCDDGNQVNDDACSNACKTPSCGDGIKQTGEDCDQGAANSDTVADACRTNCKDHRCGDGVKDTGEGCDAGTQNSDTQAGACRTSCTPAHCGDGVVDDGETCDDGNQVNDDACSNACKTPSCGDGIVQTGEECDQGAANSDTTPNACRTTCTNPRCGDSVKDAGEGCDDGNEMDTDNCRNGCILPTCGDGVIWEGVEACDDGANNSDVAPDACRTNCKKAACGDGTIDTGEVCDDGNVVNTDACTAQCQTAFCGDGIVEVGAEECDQGANNSDTAADACRTTCKKAKCGDMILDTGETCDDGNDVDTDACTNACKDAVCGDDIVEAGVEECDNGKANSDTNPGACRTTCKLAGCGDGVVDSGESCDDSNLVDDDGCSAKCALEVPEPGKQVTTVAVTVDDSGSEWGRPDEACNDVGNAANYPYTSYKFANDTGKAILARFTSAIDSGNAFIIAYSSFDASHPGQNCLAIGGDITDPDTGVPDSNHQRISLSMAAGDTVVVVVTAAFPKVPMNNLGNVTVTAESSICGDNEVDLDEQCDDGNLDNGDGCDSTCHTEPVCGNGKVEGKEACDDGNLVDGDGCSSTCTIEFPGLGHELALNGRVTASSNAFNRPEADCSASMSKTYYDEKVLTNDTGEDQSIRIEATWSPKVDDHDGIILAYVGDFSPGDPTTNCTAGGDNFDWSLDGDDTEGSRTDVFTVGAGETLHVIATTNNDTNVIGSYNVYVQNAGVSAKEAEDNGTSDVANGVDGGTVLQASIAADGDVDYFSFAATAGSTYRIETSSGTLGGCADGDDTDFTIYGADGTTVLDSATDGIGGVACASKMFQPDVDGTYYVAVTASDGMSSIDPYFLEVRRR